MVKIYIKTTKTERTITSNRLRVWWWRSQCTERSIEGQHCTDLVVHITVKQGTRLTHTHLEHRISALVYFVQPHVVVCGPFEAISWPILRLCWVLFCCTFRRLWKKISGVCRSCTISDFHHNVWAQCFRWPATQLPGCQGMHRAGGPPEWVAAINEWFFETVW